MNTLMELSFFKMNDFTVPRRTGTQDADHLPVNAESLPSEIADIRKAQSGNL